MRTVFADTLYWIALINPRDQWHQVAIESRSQLKGSQLITTDLVLVETLNYFSSYGPQFRKVVVEVVREIAADRQVDVILHTQDLFLAALNLYCERLDKGYSLTDCASMVVMRERSLSEILTHIADLNSRVAVHLVNCKSFSFKYFYLCSSIELKVFYPDSGFNQD